MGVGGHLRVVGLLVVSAGGFVACGPADPTGGVVTLSPRPFTAAGGSLPTGGTSLGTGGIAQPTGGTPTAGQPSAGGQAATASGGSVEGGSAEGGGGSWTGGADLLGGAVSSGGALGSGGQPSGGGMAASGGATIQSGGIQDGSGGADGVPELQAMTFSVTTKTQGGRYAPKNIGAIWIEDAQGKWVKTLERWAFIRARHLHMHADANTTGNLVDAKTSATLSRHQTHSHVWDLTDATGARVPDGEYAVLVEVTERDGQGEYVEVPFSLLDGPGPVSVSGNNYFADIGLELD